jgi:integrase
MGRKRFKLTWQAGKGRAGRWKKMYKGQIHYFHGGAGKSDAEAYSQAVAEFERQKLVIDAELHLARPFRHEYEEAISEWEIALAAAKDAEDGPVMVAAAAKIAELRRRAARQNPSAVSKRSDYPIRRMGLRVGQVSPVITGAAGAEGYADVELSLMDLLDVPESAEEQLATVAQRIAADSRWKERLARTKRSVVQKSSNKTLKAKVDEFVLKKQQSGVTPTFSDHVRRRLTYFQRKVGPELDASEISGKHLDHLHQELLKDTQSGVFSRTYAADVFKSCKMFIRWLHETEVLDSLPRNLTSRSLQVTVDRPTVQTYTVEGIRTVYNAASPRVRLYVLLALNCGMTQVDIAVLKPLDVDWHNGTLTRKRAKTANSERVPTVTYKLWNSTLDLLRAECSTDSEHLLTTSLGEPLRVETLRDGKLVKRDTIRGQFTQTLRSLDMKADFKSLKKTSASLLRDHPQFNGIEAVFLDHAPKSMSDKHYTKVPTSLLEAALGWLEVQFALA